MTVKSTGTVIHVTALARRRTLPATAAVRSGNIDLTKRDDRDRQN